MASPRRYFGTGLPSSWGVRHLEATSAAASRVDHFGRILVTGCVSEPDLGQLYSVFILLIVYQLNSENLSEKKVPPVCMPPPYWQTNFALLQALMLRLEDSVRTRGILRRSISLLPAKVATNMA